MGASPLISLIGNSKIVTVAYVLVSLSLLSPNSNPSNTCRNRRSSNYSYDCLVGLDGSSNSVAICFTKLPESGY